jgi:dehydratase
VLTIPGPIAGGTSATLPTVTANLTASGATSPIVLKMAGTSYSAPGMTFTANISGVGAAATKCYASPNLNLSSTPVV